jgi:hypothetical protein
LHDDNDELGKMKKYYENIIQGYEYKVQHLERELLEKNELIARLNR